MKKIMFNDKYGLTRAVKDGLKTMTRRIITDINVEAALEELWEDDAVGGTDWKILLDKVAKYKVGEIVAVAECYRDAEYDKNWMRTHIPCNPNSGIGDPFEKQYPAWSNKMFVSAEYMPTKLKITGRRFERLQDISDNDCMREGIQELDPCSECGGTIYYFSDPNEGWWFCSPREAFADLINRVSKKHIWEYNPWNVAYSFERI